MTVSPAGAGTVSPAGAGAEPAGLAPRVAAYALDPRSAAPLWEVPADTLAA